MDNTEGYYKSNRNIDFPRGVSVGRDKSRIRNRKTTIDMTNDFLVERPNFYLNRNGATVSAAVTGQMIQMHRPQKKNSINAV